MLGGGEGVLGRGLESAATRPATGTRLRVTGIGLKTPRGGRVRIRRSENMARIGGEDTIPEILVRDAVARLSASFVPHVRTPAGRPDLVDEASRIAVFVDGCFWHGCPDHYVRPRTRPEFWADKLLANTSRDRSQTAQLVLTGWRVVRMWECEVREDPTCCARTVMAQVEASAKPAMRWVVERVEVIDAAANIERRHLVTLGEPVQRRIEDGRRTTAKRGRREPAAV
jgi:DNA mismatch endonuclease (patch repair protein)